MKLMLPMRKKTTPRDLTGKPIEWFGMHSYTKEVLILTTPMPGSVQLKRVESEPAFGPRLVRYTRS